MAISQDDSLGSCQPAPGLQVNTDPGTLEMSCDVSLERVDMKRDG